MQVDMTNVNAALKQVAYHARGTSMEDLPLVPGGKLRVSTLTEVTGAQNIESALEVLGGTYFAPAVERGILIFGQSNRFSVLERFLDMIVIEKGVRMFRADPLSISVPLGFIWRKINEYYNLRMLLRGRRYQLPPNAIREELIFV
jgi:vacuolar-type H+-ATPase subunit C/Vma6